MLLKFRLKIIFLIKNIYALEYYSNLKNIFDIWTSETPNFSKALSSYLKEKASSWIWTMKGGNNELTLNHLNPFTMGRNA